MEDYLNHLVIELKLESRVKFLGFIPNLIEWYSTADIFFFPSKQEGLPVALMEAMAAGLPCVASKIRGITDLVEHGKGGYLCDAQDIDGYARAIVELAQDEKTRSEMGKYNCKAVEMYDNRIVYPLMEEIYNGNII